MDRQNGEGSFYLTRREASRYVRVCERTLDSLIKSGTIPACRVGRAVRLDRRDLDDFMAGAKTAPVKVATK